MNETHVQQPTFDEVIESLENAKSAVRRASSAKELKCIVDGYRSIYVKESDEIKRYSSIKEMLKGQGSGWSYSSIETTVTIEEIWSQEVDCGHRQLVEKLKQSVLWDLDRSTKRAEYDRRLEEFFREASESLLAKQKETGVLEETRRDLEKLAEIKKFLLRSEIMLFDPDE